VEEISPASCKLSCAATAWRFRRTVAIHFRFNGARAAEYRPCDGGIWKETRFRSTDFVIRTDGVCRLNPEVARMVTANGSA
jgi:hypothetical protein